MMEQNAIRAALDFSWNEASIALADRQNRLLFSNTIMLKDTMRPCCRKS